MLKMDILKALVDNTNTNLEDLIDKSKKFKPSGFLNYVESLDAHPVNKALPKDTDFIDVVSEEVEDA